MSERIVRQAALRRALALIPVDHVGWCHQAYEPLAYQPDVCPGCASAVIRELIEEMASDA